MHNLTPDAAQRLVKLCGMFGSDHTGERANAAHLADQLVRQHGLTWSDVIRTVAHQPIFSIPATWCEPRNWRDAITIILQHKDLLTEWEVQFARSLRSFRILSERQRKSLWGIVDKLRKIAYDEVAA